MYFAYANTDTNSNFIPPELQYETLENIVYSLKSVIKITNKEIKFHFVCYLQRFEHICYPPFKCRFSAECVHEFVLCLNVQSSKRIYLGFTLCFAMYVH